MVWQRAMEEQARELTPMEEAFVDAAVRYGQRWRM